MAKFKRVFLEELVIQHNYRIVLIILKSKTFHDEYDDGKRALLKIRQMDGVI